MTIPLFERVLSFSAFASEVDVGREERPDPSQFKMLRTISLNYIRFFFADTKEVIHGTNQYSYELLVNPR